MKIKRYIFLVAALLLMGQGASAWSGSGNSASDPILIANANDWNTLATPRQPIMLPPLHTSMAEPSKISEQQVP